MKKRPIVRVFNFSYSKLVTLAHEKIAFMRRDAEAYSAFGINEGDVTALETAVTNFENTVTDIEVLNSQTAITAQKEAKAEELRVAIRGVMARVVLKFPVTSAQYRKFGTEALAQKKDTELLFIAKRVILAATEALTDLSSKGITLAMLDNVLALRDELETLMMSMEMKIAARDIYQEIRTEMANAIYTTLVKYTNTGLSIWEALDVAKYNDYIIYED